MYLLDTSVYVEIEQGLDKTISQVDSILTKHPGTISICSPVYSEIYYGLLKIKNNQLKLEKLNTLPLVQTTKKSSKILSLIKQDLEKKGLMIPVMDMIIASIAKDIGAILLTKDKHFTNINDLNVIFLG